MEPITAQVSKHVDAPPSDVWKAITDPVRLKRFFFGAEVESGWQPGDPIRMRGEFIQQPGHSCSCRLMSSKYKCSEGKTVRITWILIRRRCDEHELGLNFVVLHLSCKACSCYIKSMNSRFGYTE